MRHTCRMGTKILFTYFMLVSLLCKIGLSTDLTNDKCQNKRHRRTLQHKDDINMQKMLTSQIYKEKIQSAHHLWIKSILAQLRRQNFKYILVQEKKYRGGKYALRSLILFFPHHMALYLSIKVKIEVLLQKVM